MYSMRGPDGGPGCPSRDCRGSLEGQRWKELHTSSGPTPTQETEVQRGPTEALRAQEWQSLGSRCHAGVLSGVLSATRHVQWASRDLPMEWIRGFQC